jgi:hypothetical protein
MILKIDQLSPAQFASLATFLVSAENIIGNATAIDDHPVGTSNHPPAIFSSLISNKSLPEGKHSVVLGVAEHYSPGSIEQAEERRSGRWTGRTTPDEPDRMVPASYLINLFHAIGFYPE